MSRNQKRFLRLENLEDRCLLAGLDLTGVEFRTIDGVDNNPNLPNQGAADTVQIRFGYGDDFPDDNGDTIITSPNPRLVSNTIHAQTGSIESVDHLTDWSFQWGQWVTHDMDKTRDGAEFNNGGNFNIPVSPDDPLYNPAFPFIPFNRSEYADGTGENGIRREVTNIVTSYIDASNVYGSDVERSNALRTFEGGRLKTSDGDLLPYWDPDSGLEQATPPQGVPGPGDTPLFLAGDIRANEQVGLTAVHTLFVREHNRLADRIATLYPELNDEQIFQFARRLVGAEQQVITYEEYLPTLLGYDLTVDPYTYAYSPGTFDELGQLVGNVEGDITNAFAHAAFRFGHSQINEQTLLVGFFNQVSGTLSIDDAFFNPSFLADDPNNLARLLKGLAFQTGQEVDVHLVDGIRNNLFSNVGGGGIDLAALDIQRGRDHGLPDFNNLLNAFRTGTPYTSFDDPGDANSFAARNPESAAAGIVDQLKLLYPTDPGDPDNTGINAVDAFVGMLAEDHLPGSSVGPVLNSMIRNQFLRLMDGDRFFYTGDAFLQQPEVKAVLDINEVTLGKVIHWNTGAIGLQENVFFDRSVLFVEAPSDGANLSVVAAAGVVTVVNNDNGQVLALRSLANVERVVLVGSSTSADVFNLFVGYANGGIEDGIVAYGRGSAPGTSDVLNVYGRLLQHDTFTVTDSSFSTGTVTGLRRGNGNPANNAITLDVSGRDVDVNGNNIFSSGFETNRLVTLGGYDSIINDDLLELLVARWHDPGSDD
ncbi:MAG: peroxidase family protein [Pirellulaceae bacterium]